MKYFIADLHLHHEKVAAIRRLEVYRRNLAAPQAELPPWASGSESMMKWNDTELMRGIKALDPANDQLWILGDICSGGKESMLHALGELVLVKAPIYLVTGNHDPVNPMHRNAHKVWAEFSGVFQAIYQHARVRINGQNVLLSHYPYAGDGDRDAEERYTQYRLPDLGEWLLHGHTHSSVLRSGHHSICVSADATGMKPISEQEIARIMKEEWNEPAA